MRLTYNDRRFIELPNETLAMLYQESNHAAQYGGLYMRTHHYNEDFPGSARIAVISNPTHVNDFFI